MLVKRFDMEEMATPMERRPVSIQNCDCLNTLGSSRSSGLLSAGSIAESGRGAAPAALCAAVALFPLLSRGRALLKRASRLCASCFAMTILGLWCRHGCALAC